MYDIKELPIDTVRDQTFTAQRIDGNYNSAEANLKPIVDSLRVFALDYARNHKVRQWLIDSLQGMLYLDGIVAAMRHIERGQYFVLSKLEELQPDLCWYRGGTLLKWGDTIGTARDYFTPEQLDTYIIDGGANGALGRPDLALSFLRLTQRKHPTLYSLTLADLKHGLKIKAISIGTEHNYDLCINEGEDRIGYLQFCRDNLKIQPVSLS